MSAGHDGDGTPPPKATGTQARQHAELKGSDTTIPTGTLTEDRLSAGADPLDSGFQREEVAAAVRSPGFHNNPDPRGVAVATATAAQLVGRFGDQVLEWNNWRDEVTVVVRPEAVPEVARWLRDEAGFALLSDLSPCDWLDRRTKRFSVDWHVTKLEPGAPRLRMQAWVDEGESLPSVIDVWPTADWHEREAYDFFGIEFSGRFGLRRLIMPDDWEGHPLRKDYPMGGEPVKFTNSLREV